MMVSLNKRLVISLALAQTISGYQLWHEVNRYDAHGNECPTNPKYNVTCPAVCVSDVSMCPDSIQPDCPRGQSFCVDGQCHDECTDDLINPCHCSRSGSKLPSEANGLVPCVLLANVNITQLHAWKPEQDTYEACAGSVGIENQDELFGVWGKTWATGDLVGVWAQCPKSPAPNYKYNESYWLATFSVCGAMFGLIAIWSLYKFWAERNVRSMISYILDGSDAKRSGNPASLAGSEKNKDDVIDEKTGINEKADLSGGKHSSSSLMETMDTMSREVTLKGYRDHWFGKLCIWYMFAVNILWICYLGVWSADYYGSLPGKRHGVLYSLAYESDFLELATFLIIWGLYFLNLIVLYVVKPYIRNYFRIQTLPSDGHYVCAVRPVKEVKMLIDKEGWIQRQINYITEKLRLMLSSTKDFTTCKIQRTSEGRIYFTYQCTRYVFDDNIQQFAPFDFDLGTSHRGLIRQAEGLTSKDANYRLELVGPNFIEVHVPSIVMGFVRECVSFFYIYQFVFLWAFYFYAYYQVGLVDTGVVIISATIKVLLRRASEKRLKRMAEQEEEVTVKRDGEWVQISTKSLVPGDVIEITTGAHMSCDCILISGNAIMNESSLTGEPLPIRKFPLHIDDSHYDQMGAGKLSTLYSGTIVSQVQPITKSTDTMESDKVLALVNKTGTASDKGQLVRRILFPNPLTFIFNEQMRIVVAILVLYSVFVMGMAAYLYQGNSVAIVFYGVFAIAQLLSPLLPAAMVIGQSIAAARLRRKHIYSVDPQRIMIAGKVQVFCFDKTGTLTKEGLEFYGGKCVNAEAKTFDTFNSEITELTDLFQLAVASCHAVTDLNGQLIGNPVDIEQFRASKFSIDPEPQYLDAMIPPEGSKLSKIHVVRRFEFVHARASMSVAILDEATGKLHVFVKGSFERIKSISNSGSIPDDYDQACADLAGEGCYVLAIAHKELDISPDEITKMSQDDIEWNCDLCGLLIFKNMLKEDTAQAIAELKGGSTRTVMITGDTALTGIYIARQCGMIPEGNRVLLGECKSHERGVTWRDVDSGEPVSHIEPLLDAEKGADGFPTTELALTGAAFEYLYNSDRLDSILFNTRVFARMKPTNKVECIEHHMKYACTAMCGDGGNDCGALRAAHVGLALSDAEASIVSPFSSANRSVMSAVQLLIESRAGLATSFANFTALICYGQIMAGMLKMASFYFTISITQNVWMLVDGAIATGLALTVSMSGPAKKLAPFRPTSRLLGPQMLCSIGGIVLMNWLFSAMSYVWLFSQDWFRCHEHSSAEADATKWWLQGDNYEASVLSFVSLFQFINNGLLVNYGYLHRARWYKNYPLMFVWAFLFIISSVMLLAEPNRMGCAFRLNCGSKDVLEKEFGINVTWGGEDYNNPIGHNIIPHTARYKLWGYCLGNTVATNLWQLFVINGPIRNILRKKKPLRRLKVKL